VQVYLARMREAVEDYESVAGKVHPDDFLYAPFHTPFPGMVRKAALLAYRHITRDTEIEETLAEEIGTQPRESEFDGEDAFLDAVSDYTDELKETTRYQEWYEATIDPTLDIARHVGNWYTGSVHVARLAALKRAHEAGREMTDERLFLASYGSGAQAEVHHETVQPGWSDEIAALNIDEQIEARYDLDFAEYELVHEAHDHSKNRDYEEFTTPDAEFVLDGWGRMGERKYRYVE